MAIRHRSEEERGNCERITMTMIMRGQENANPVQEIDSEEWENHVGCFGKVEWKRRQRNGG